MTTLFKPYLKGGRYCNPKEWCSSTIEEQGFTKWKDPEKKEFLTIGFKSEDKSEIPCCEELDKTLPINKQHFQKLYCHPQHGIQLMWIGHSSLVVQFDGLTFLTDPIFSKKCSPVQMPLFGCSRYRDPPCSVDDLPNIDAVIISHDHYDHLDLNTVQQLDARFGDKLSWFVPLGFKPFFQTSGSVWNYLGYGLNCKNIYEHNWWDTNEIVKNGKRFEFVCTPAQHWCQRGVTDMNKRLWCSWVVKGPNHKFFFAGDTGYCPAFRQIGKHYGPFDVAAIPIGAYEPRWYMKPQHVSPEEAVDIFKDVNTSHLKPSSSGNLTATVAYVNDRQTNSFTGDRKELPNTQEEADTLLEKPKPPEDNLYKGRNIEPSSIGNLTATGPCVNDSQQTNSFSGDRNEVPNTQEEADTLLEKLKPPEDDLCKGRNVDPRSIGNLTATGAYVNDRQINSFTGDRNVLPNTQEEADTLLEKPKPHEDNLCKGQNVEPSSIGNVTATEWSINDSQQTNSFTGDRNVLPNSQEEVDTLLEQPKPPENNLCKDRNIEPSSIGNLTVTGAYINDSRQNNSLIGDRNVLPNMQEETDRLLEIIKPPEDSLYKGPNVDPNCKFIGIHWGTFKQLGCFEFYLEPPLLVQKAMANLMIPSTCFVPIQHGEVKTIGSEKSSL